MFPDFLKVIVGVPLFGTLLVALLPFIHPVSRWRRRVKTDLELANGLPTGPERDYFERSAATLARRIIAYREDVPMRFKAPLWMGAAGLLYSVIATMIVGLPDDLGWGEIPLTIGAIIGGTVASIGALSGRVGFYLTWPEDHQATLEKDRQLTRRATIRARASRRARRMKRRNIPRLPEPSV